jgi:membrane protein required for colicin V production
MILDIITLAVLAYAVMKGMSRGLIVSAFSFAGLFVGLVVAMRFSTTAAAWLSGFDAVPPRWLPFLAFLLVFLAARWLVSLGGRMVEASAEAVMLGGLDKAGGVVLHVFLYGCVYSIVLFYLRPLGLPGEETLSASRSYPWVAPWGPWALKAVQAVFPFLGDMLRELQDQFRQGGAPLPAPRA